jgi:membrane protease YdiL (CAAX protease family)
MKNKGIGAYLLQTFLGAWGLWLIGWVAASRVFRISPTNLLFQFVLLPGAFMPAMAAIIVRKWITHEDFSDAGLQLNFRRNWKYYIFAAYILPIVVLGSIVGLAALFGISYPDFSLHRSLAILVPQVKPSSVQFTTGLWVIWMLQLMLTGIPIAALVTWGEEFGWRSYLQIRLFAERPVLAAVVTGLIWGLWHYPLIFLGYEHYENIGVGLVVFPVCTILLSIIFGWLRMKTGSIWSSSIAHGATNSLGASLALLLFLGGPKFTFVSYLGILSWIPLGALCAWILLTKQLITMTPASLASEAPSA